MEKNLKEVPGFIRAFASEEGEILLLNSKNG
jgi:hypothetical protein